MRPLAAAANKETNYTSSGDASATLIRISWLRHFLRCDSCCNEHPLRNLQLATLQGKTWAFVHFARFVQDNVLKTCCVCVQLRKRQNIRKVCAACACACACVHMHIYVQGNANSMKGLFFICLSSSIIEHAPHCKYLLGNRNR